MVKLDCTGSTDCTTVCSNYVILLTSRQVHQSTAQYLHVLRFDERFYHVFHGRFFVFFFLQRFTC